MFDDVLEFMDGKSYVLDGISGVFKYSKRNLLSGDFGTVSLRYELVHEADEIGRQNDAYRQVRRMLGDDYVTDMTWSERLVDIAVELGYTG